MNGNGCGRLFICTKTTHCPPPGQAHLGELRIWVCGVYQLLRSLKMRHMHANQPMGVAVKNKSPRNSRKDLPY